MNPFQRLLAEAGMSPPPWESCRATHLLVALLKLGSDTFQGPVTHANPATEVRDRLRQAGASPLVTESEFFRAMEKRFN
jgi:hypothetical protein